MASPISIFLLCFFFSFLSVESATDAAALLALKSMVDPTNTSLLHWPPVAGVGNFCRWEGVRECLKGRVSKLVLEHLNLTGKLDGESLNRLDQLRVLSFKDNKLSGEIPDFSGLPNLKSLYLNGNAFNGTFPVSLTKLHRLKTIVLSDNHLAGEIPPEIASMPRLYTLYLENNDFTGQIPPLNQPSLQFLNLSGNNLSGEVPKTLALNRFNSSSFLNNPELCGKSIQTPCLPPPATSFTAAPENHKNRKKIIIIAASSAAAAAILLLILLLVVGASQRRRRKVTERERDEKKGEEGGGGGPGSPATGVREVGEGSGYGGGGGLKGGFSWEGEGLGKLVFVSAEASPEEVRYSLEELLKASAETLGRGTIGSTYKAVMESGYIVTVKRLKEARYPRMEKFRRQMEVIGRMRHPNLVAVRAYFQAKEERLLVYDYFPNGSLFSLIHGSRPSGGGKPLHWTSCLKIAEDLATGLLYIHQNFEMAHGNLKSSNVLLGSDFESCLTDYCLQSFRNPDTIDQESSAISLFYKAPECRVDPSRRPPHPPTTQSDVYSFGVILLELLTGKTPFQDLVQEHGSDIPKWVRSVREEETESGDEPSSGNETSEEKLAALLNIAMTCVAIEPENRPQMREVLRMVRESRSEAQMSSNSSDHSPGRWSDTVQSLPREEHQSI